MFGQVVIGPPGAGKSTYCAAMREFLAGAGRNVAVVNLDPANDQTPYSCALDVQKLISANDVMEKMQLGPNGALMYCLEYLETNVDWLIGKLDEIKAADKHTYLLFDCPGQVELYTHHSSMRNILKRLEKLDFRLVTVNLIDSHYCTNPANYISAVLTCLSAMIQLELPHINVLSKVDLIEVFHQLPFSLEYFTDVLDLNFCVDKIGADPFFNRYEKLSHAIAGVIQDYSLVNFIPLNIQDKESMMTVAKEADKANGNCFGEAEERSVRAMYQVAMSDTKSEFIATAEDRYCR